MKHWRLAVAALMCISAFAQLQQNVKPAIATTVAPTYLNSTNVFLSTDLTGSLRIACITGCTSGSSGTSSTFGAAFPATGTAAGFIGSTGNMAGGNLTAAGALKTDASATTQPVSGTISATQGTSPWVVGGTVSTTQGTSPWVVSGTVTANQGTSPWITAGGGTAGTAATGVVTVQGIASMTKLLVTPDSVALPANQSVNVSQINGVTPLMGNGVTGTGSQRVTIASDNTAFPVNATLSAETTKVIGTVNQGTSPWVSTGPGTAGSAAAGVMTVQGIASMTKLLVTPDSVALPANQSVNVSQINGVTPLMGNGVTGTGSQRVTISSDNTAFPVNATLSAETTKVIGTVNQGTSPWIAAGGGTAGSAASGVVTVQGIASMTKLLVTPDSVALPANQSVNVSQINGVTPLMGNGVTGTGSPRVTIASDNTAFTVNAAESGTWTVQPGNTPNTSAWIVQPIGGTTNGLTPFTLQPAASDNHTVVKNGAALVYHISAFNNSATINYLRIYDAGTGFNGCNSATNLKHSVMIPASTSAAGFVEEIGLGIGLASGLSICVTSVYGNTDTTNATASAMLVNIDYK